MSLDLFGSASIAPSCNMHANPKKDLSHAVGKMLANSYWSDWTQEGRLTCQSRVFAYADVAVEFILGSDTCHKFSF